jgi:hypothetical protein
MFVQLRPFPLYPALQAHVKIPGVSVQVASAWQLLPLPSPLHSSSFVQITPSPLYPALHAHVKLPSVSVQVASA